MVSQWDAPRKRLGVSRPKLRSFDSFSGKQQTDEERTRWVKQTSWSDTEVNSGGARMDVEEEPRPVWGLGEDRS